MHSIHLASSLLRSVAYLPATQILDVTLQSGRRYRYHDVPTETYEALLAAPSAGVFFNRSIRPAFNYTRVDRP